MGSGLRAIDGQFSLSAGALQFRQYRFDDARLEAQLAGFAGQERPENTEPVPVGVPAVVEEAFIQARGFTGIRPGQATTYAAKPTTFTFGIPGVDLVVTRYFEHR